jgi:hypothetical protein
MEDPKSQDEAATIREQSDEPIPGKLPGEGSAPAEQTIGEAGTSNPDAEATGDGPTGGAATGGGTSGDGEATGAGGSGGAPADTSTGGGGGGEATGAGPSGGAE